jgi:hypothetical protein
MYFNMKSYLKNTRNYTAKHTHNHASYTDSNFLVYACFFRGQQKVRSGLVKIIGFDC